MNNDSIIDFLTYRSWWYQVHWYGMSKESARRLFKDWKAFEEKDQQEQKEKQK